MKINYISPYSTIFTKTELTCLLFEHTYAHAFAWCNAVCAVAPVCALCVANILMGIFHRRTDAYSDSRVNVCVILVRLASPSMRIG